jgi:DNA-binding Lrp family transcriptional regulator
MDDTDIRLVLLLLENSRQPYRELAKRLGLSVNAVYNRLQNLVDTGVIARFITSINLKYYNGTELWMFGHSTCDNLEMAIENLVKNDCIFWTARSGGNYLYVGAYVKDMSQIEAISTFVKAATKMDDITVGIIANSLPSPPQGVALSDMDYRIINAIHHDSRRSIADIATEAGTSSKTVSNRLVKMEKNFLIQHSIEWYPDKVNDITAFFHAHLVDSGNKVKIGKEITNTFAPNILFSISFVNIPDFLLFITWARTMKTVSDLGLKLQQYPFKSVMTDVLFTGKIYDTWRDRDIEERGKRK